MKPKTVTTRILQDFYHRLHEAFGPQNWWPADSADEMAVGAILTQNTAWTNVLRALQNLRQASCLEWPKIHTIPMEELAELIRPAGYFRVKSRRLKAFATVLQEQFGGSLQGMLSGPLDEVRDRLLAIHGVGPETADSILLYAGAHPTFVVDAYTQRILRRHFFIGPRAGYEEVRQLFQRRLPADAALYNEYHALLVRLAKNHCRAKADCAGCPLENHRHDATR